MKAATTTGFGPRARLIIKDVNKPRIGADDVLVEVHASSVNPKDWKLNYNISSLVPKVGCLSSFHIIGDDLAGVIVERGSNVSNFKVGDKVYGMDMRLRTAACSEYACIATKRIAHMPNNISFNEAAAVPLAALTALQAFQMGSVSNGSKVLVIGASGGVGTFAIQIAKAMSAEVTGVCSGKNIELVTSLGADKVIDYTQGDFKSEKNNFDLVFDATAYESLTTCASLMADDGLFVSTAGHGKALFNAYRPHLFMGDKSAKPVWVESYTSDLEILKDFIESGAVTPVIDSVHQLANIEDAYIRSKTGRSRGKVVIQIV
ncbi:NAD(P)-dependent alcohol dehydrogenase [Zhongshania sp. BJYM1]|uniref:NAD(P)-dependent alcohol dehydrogenase n=1 Tax=Zhongshania aquatica TaxID=2965069 RepID=UPI0022B3384C|nr:NAD(P)-dependent alcohol dehydrogenase [Marortus sp. BJYM1]